MTEEIEATDPAAGDFLGHLARDIESHPENLKPIDPGLAARIAAVTRGGDSDAGTRIVGDLAL